MGDTLINKIIKMKGVVKDDYAVLDLDLVMSHDTTTPLAIESFNNFIEKSHRRMFCKLIILTYL